ncbi:MAG: methyltransferase domain-containing protein [Gemmatimonadales bacterium]
MIASDLLSLLRCPTCRGELVLEAGRNAPEVPSTVDEEGVLRCTTCGERYPTRRGFPVLFPAQTLHRPEWVQWNDHLEKFQARRDSRVQNPERPINRIAERSQPQPSFGRFVGIEEGAVLDVGCGPGKFRFQLDPQKVRYVGLDPIALPDVGEFPFVQGLAEYMPFRDGSFTDVVVLAALDHFRDLDQFLSETARVLTAGGRLHIMQSVHEVRGPVSAVKVMAHKIKDALEDRVSARHGSDVPKHLSEFTSRALVERMASSFDVVSTDTYSATWYSPEKLFLTFRPKSDVPSLAHPA